MFTVIGDVHQKYSHYRALCSQFPYTVQIGDMGFEYGRIGVDTDKHVMFGGNHDNYDSIAYYPGYLGKFGNTSHNNTEFFFVGGAFSIDLIVRQAQFLNGHPKSWWWQEELAPSEMFACYELYKIVRPKIMLSHTFPKVMVDRIGNPQIMDHFGWGSQFESKTSNFLQMLWAEHQPDLWVGGHFHMDREEQIGNTKFVVVSELGTFDVS